MNDGAEDFDWNEVDEDVLKLLISNADAFLQAQLDIALASDQRSMSFASVMAAISIGVTGAVVSDIGLPPMPFLASAIFFVIATVAGMLAARPTRIHLPGFDPNYIGTKKFLKSSKHEALSKELYTKSQMIEESRLMIRTSQKLYVGGLYAGCIGGALSTISAFYLHLC